VPTLQPEAIATPANSGAGPPGRRRRPPGARDPRRHHSEPPVRPSAGGQRADGSGGLGATGGLEWPYASAVERPAPRETAPLAAPGSPRGGARGGVSPPRRAAQGRGAGIPPTAAAGPAPGAERAPTSRTERRRRRYDLAAGHRLAAATPTQPESPEPLEPHRRSTATDARPLPAAPTATPPNRLVHSRLLLASPRWFTPFASRTLTSLSLIRLRWPPPRLRPLQLPRLGWPVQVYLAGRGRGSGARQRTPFLAKPRRGAKETPRAGRGLLR
jgi:hypothetical protein